MLEYNWSEKRRSQRVPVKLRAGISKKNLEKTAPTVDISCHGVLVRTRSSFNPGEEVKLSLDLPIKEKPVQFKARIVRTVTICSAWGFKNFDVGMKFTSVAHQQKKDLEKTIDYLLEKTAKTGF